MLQSKGDRRDIVGGLLLIGVGLFAAIYAIIHYGLGTVSQMGPGMIPMALGYMLTGLGIVILISALLRPARALGAVSWRPLIMVSLSVASFALVIERFGLVPAVAVLCVFAILAEGALRLPVMVALTTGLALLAVLIFGVGLSVPIPFFRMPF